MTDLYMDAHLLETKEDKVIKAFKEGKKIQSRMKEGGSIWIDIDTPTWNFRSKYYRIKPEPRILYLFINDGLVEHVTDNLERISNKDDYVKFVEVCDED